MSRHCTTEAKVAPPCYFPSRPINDVCFPFSYCRNLGGEGLCSHDDAQGARNCFMLSCAQSTGKGLQVGKIKKDKADRQTGMARGVPSPTMKPCLHHPGAHVCQSHHKRRALSSLGSSALLCKWLIIVSVFFDRTATSISLLGRRAFLCLGNVAAQRRGSWLGNKRHGGSIYLRHKTWHNNNRTTVHPSLFPLLRSL